MDPFIVKYPQSLTKLLTRKELCGAFRNWDLVHTLKLNYQVVGWIVTILFDGQHFSNHFGLSNWLVNVGDVYRSSQVVGQCWNVLICKRLQNERFLMIQIDAIFKPGPQMCNPHSLKKTPPEATQKNLTLPETNIAPENRTPQ